MRPAFVLSLVVLALAAAGPSHGQGKPRRRPPAPAAQTVQATPTVPLAASGQSRRPVAVSPPDAGPACRAQCSKDRYSCHAEDDATDCDGRWLACLSVCRQH